MLRAAGRGLTYANCMATLAVFVALGGTSYAAFRLPRDSVGPAQLKRNAVGGSEIRSSAVRSREIANASLQLSDISDRTRSALQGVKGDPGPRGPAGPPAARFFATVAASGEFLRGNATSGGARREIGSYEVRFGANLSSCSYVATLGTTDTGNPPPGRITVNDVDGAVGVRTYGEDGMPANLPFHLIVAC